MPYDPMTGKWIPDTIQNAMGGAIQAGAGQFTPEQNAYIMENMPAITQQESEIARAEALSNQLRGAGMGGQGKRMDWASQAARGIQGIGGGMQEKARREGVGALDTKMGEFAKGLGKLFKKKDEGHYIPGSFNPEN